MTVVTEKQLASAVHSMNWLEFPPTQTDYKITIEKNYRPSKNLIDAGHDAVLEIASKYPRPFYLMCSGGVDSQAMAYIWSKTGVPFDCINFLYTDNQAKFYNTHDIDTFHQFARLNNIPYRSKIFNYWQFLENDLELLSETYNCASPQITAYIALSDTIADGTVIFSGNFFRTYIPPFDYDILALDRYSQNCTTHKVIPFFLCYTKDLAFISNIIRFPQFHNSYKEKCEIYRHFGIPIVEQETKLSGFELIKDYFDNLPELVSAQDRLRYCNEQSQRVFDLAYRYKLRDKLGPRPNIILY